MSMNKSESIVEISKALARFQEEVKQPLKDADNPFFKSKYVPLENVVEAISDCGPKNGLSFVQWPKNDETGRVGVATLLMHTSGEFIEFDAVFMKADKESPQGAGALITYLKRYSLSAIYSITSDADDDGNTSSGNNNKNEPSKQRTNPEPVTSEQVGLIKSKAMEFAKLRGRKDEEVYAKLNISDVEKITSEYANKSIKILDKWLNGAKGDNSASAKANS